MELDCLILCTNLDYRRELLNRTAGTLMNACPFPGQRLVTVDNFAGYPSVELDGWKVFGHDRVGMVKNLEANLDKVKTEWMIYSEDDVLFNQLPNQEELLELMNTKFHDKYPSIITPLLGRSIFGEQEDEVDIEISTESNWQKVGNLLIWEMNTPASCYIEFPTCIIRTEVLRNCLQTAYSVSPGRRIEQAFSVAYRHLGYDKQFTKVSFMRDFRNEKSIKDLNARDILTLLYPKYLCIENRDNNDQIMSIPSVGTGYEV